VRLASSQRLSKDSLHLDFLIRTQAVVGTKRQQHAPADAKGISAAVERFIESVGPYLSTLRRRGWSGRPTMR